MNTINKNNKLFVFDTYVFLFSTFSKNLIFLLYIKLPFMSWNIYKNFFLFPFEV